MPPPNKRTPEETWDALEKMALEDEVERVLALSEKDLDDELRAAGADPRRVRARGRAVAAQIASGRTRGDRPAASPSRVTLLRRGRWVAMLAAALGAIVVASTRGPAWYTRGDPHRDLEKAGALRAKASRECGAAAWRACLSDFDEARLLDPGRRRPTVRPGPAGRRHGGARSRRRRPLTRATAGKGAWPAADCIAATPGGAVVRESGRSP